MSEQRSELFSIIMRECVLLDSVTGDCYVIGGRKDGSTEVSCSGWIDDIRRTFRYLIPEEVLFSWLLMACEVLNFGYGNGDYTEEHRWCAFVVPVAVAQVGAVNYSSCVL